MSRAKPVTLLMNAEAEAVLELVVEQRDALEKALRNLATAGQFLVDNRTDEGCENHMAQALRQARAALARVNLKKGK